MSLSKHEWKVRAVDSKTATALVVKNHYLHRRAPCSFAFGLFNSADELKGVIIYGTPSSAPLRSGVAGKENAGNVIELTRLWVADDVPKNGESFLIGRTVRQVNKEIVVSYAEAAQGHVGFVYQATNWLYTGLSAKRTNWTIDGVSKHCQTLADKYTAAEIRRKYGKRFSLVERPRKHRYVFINAKTKRRKKELLAALKYPLWPYPKPAAPTLQKNLTA